MILHGKDLIVSIDGNTAFASKSCSLEVSAKSIENTSPTSGEWEENVPGKKSWKLSTSQLVKKAESSDMPTELNSITTFALTNSINEGWMARGEQVEGTGVSYVFDEAGFTEGINILRVNSSTCQLLEKTHYNKNATGLLAYLNSNTINNDDILIILPCGEYVLPPDVVNIIDLTYHTSLPFIEVGYTSIWENVYDTTPLIIVCGKGLNHGYTALNSTSNSLNFSLVNGTNFGIDGIPGAIEMVGKMVNLRMTDNNGSIWVGQAEVTDFKVTGTKGNLMAGSFSFKGNGKIQNNKKIEMPDFYTPNKFVDRIIIDMSQNDSTQMIKGDIDGYIFRDRMSFLHRYLGKYMGSGTMALCQLDDNDSTKYANGTTATLDGTQGDVYVGTGGFFYKIDQIDENRVMFSIASQLLSNEWKIWPNYNLIGAFQAQATTNYNNNTIAGSGEDYYVRSILSGAGAKPDSFNNFTTQMQKMNPAYFSKTGPEEHAMIALLYMMKHGETNCQLLNGSGVGSLLTGSTAERGIKESGLEYGATNIFGLEAWWGGVREWMDRINVTGNTWTINHLGGGSSISHASVINQDADYRCITKLKFGTEKLFMVPDGVMSSLDFQKNFCDGLGKFAASVENYKVLRGGYGPDPSSGIFAMFPSDADYGSSSMYSTRLCFHGINVVEYSPSTFEVLTAVDPAN